LVLSNGGRGSPRFRSAELVYLAPDCTVVTRLHPPGAVARRRTFLAARRVSPRARPAACGDGCTAACAREVTRLTNPPPRPDAVRTKTAGRTACGERGVGGESRVSDLRRKSVVLSAPPLVGARCAARLRGRRQRSSVAVTCAHVSSCGYVIPNAEPNGTTCLVPSQVATVSDAYGSRVNRDHQLIWVDHSGRRSLGRDDAMVAS